MLYFLFHNPKLFLDFYAMVYILVTGIYRAYEICCHWI